MTEIRQEIERVLQVALHEDRGFGDLTSDSIFENENAEGLFLSKDEGVLCGLTAISSGYGLLSAEIKTVYHKKDGESVCTGDVIAEVKGPARELLTGERVILNLIQHLSGIATSVNKAVKLLDDPKIRICDTRKTLPGLRMLQKYAVRTGGGTNHRFRLDDGVMIKDNHIAAAGSIKTAVEKTRKRIGPLVKIEVETENENEVQQAVEAGADVIMLDNKSPGEVRSLCSLIPDHILVEVSGGITPGTIGSFRGCGADFISIGSLTHSVTAMDISFNLKGGKK